MSETQSSVAVVPVSAPSSHPAPSEGRVDLVAAERAARDLLTALGADLGREGLARTPARVARAYAEMLERPLLEATTFPNEEAYDELVVLSSVPFHSLCEHHLLPFHGVDHLGYLAGERILGLSKLARALAFFARDLQVQERLTMQVADCLESGCGPGASAWWWRPSISA
ncbi:MAG: GTP cyclohydrolase I [Thermoleophilaceae bacterium]